MAQRSLGRITFAGGAPKRATDNWTDTIPPLARQFVVTHDASNTHAVIVGDATLNGVSGDGVLQIIQPPNVVGDSATWTSLPTIGHEDSIDMAGVFLDGTPGESVYISYIE